jgi:porin
MNLAFVAPPSGVFPPVVVGAILKYNYKPFDLTFMVYDPDDRTNEYGTDRLFSKGVNLSLGGAWSGKVAGRPTNLALTGIYSTRDGADLSQVLLPTNLKTNPKEGSFNVALQFGHLLLQSQTQPGKGIGLYAKGSIADGNPNPIRASFIGGIAGHGIVPSRPLDSFGLGYYFYKFSDDLQDAVNPKIHFGDEQGFEAFYNLAATPWFRLTADLQAIDPANGASKKAVIAALRANVAF